MAINKEDAMFTGVRRQRLFSIHLVDFENQGESVFLFLEEFRYLVYKKIIHMVCKSWQTDVWLVSWDNDLRLLLNGDKVQRDYWVIDYLDLCSFDRYRYCWSENL